MAESARYETSEEVDFVIVGSGAAGGVLAKELSTNGFSVVVLEQGEYRRSSDFNHDELDVMFNGGMAGGFMRDHPQTFRPTPSDPATVPGMIPAAWYAHTVGGSSVHFSGNYWRFRPEDFKERSMLGEIAGTGFADWPLTYEELEPYYTKVEWEIGVSGEPGPYDAPRSRPYPMPPLPVKSSGVLFERGARKIGLQPQAAPLAILSQPFNGRGPCIHCGFCLGFGCESGAKSSTMISMIPIAEATGRCEIRPLSTVMKLNSDKQGRIRDVLYVDAQGKEHAQRARAVIVAANGAETPRLLFLSATQSQPQGLANSSGLVGKYMMFNGHSAAHGAFQNPLNEYKGVQCSRIALDHYSTDPKRGYYGGGGLDARPFISATPILYALNGLPPGTPTWGRGYKQALRHYFTHSMAVLGSTTSLAVADNGVDLDPEIKDKWGRPALRVTYTDHPDDLATASFLQDQAIEILDAAGASETWRSPVAAQSSGVHLLGTCRMGDDPATSVTDRYHRTHDVRNLFICDGSSFVTSGRGQPTMTIQALAFRAAEHIGQFARRNEI
ncbi:MAG: GMC family oxidoreductase [Gammaproteobacteria bacterium]